MLWLLVALAVAGEQVRDMEIAHRFTRAPGGMVLHTMGWTAGRGRCSGSLPSVQPGPDGRPCTYHDPSPWVPAPAFLEHIEQARGLDVAGWVEACDVGAAYCGWLRGLDDEDQGAAWEQARMSLGLL